MSRSDQSIGNMIIGYGLYKSKYIWGSIAAPWSRARAWIKRQARAISLIRTWQEPSSNSAVTFRCRWSALSRIWPPISTGDTHNYRATNSRLLSEDRSQLNSSVTEPAGLLCWRITLRMNSNWKLMRNTTTTLKKDPYNPLASSLCP